MFIYSRPNTALRLLGLPFMLLALAAKTAFVSTKIELASALSDLSEEAPDAIRYVLTGRTGAGAITGAIHDAGVAAIDTGRAASGKVAAAFQKQLGYRALAIFLLVMLPFFTVWAIVETLRDDNVFEGFGGLIADLSRDFVSARNPIR